MAAQRKVLLIGWDAADWEIILPMLDRGELPNLERLVNDGIIGNLATLHPALSPMLWTSIATGKRAHKHGIYGFVEPDPGTGEVRPITNLSRQSKAIWNILNQNGLRSNVIGWWPSHPVEPINGVMVSNYFHQPSGKVDEEWPIKPDSVHPKRLESALKSLRIHPYELDEDQLLPFIPRAAEIDQSKDQRLGTLAKCISECASVHAVATGVMQLEPWDFMAVYYDALDHFQHAFMPYFPPKLEWISDGDFAMYQHVVSGAYRFHDMMLGTLLKLVDDETNIFLVSDHGFQSGRLRPRELPNEPAGPAAEHRNYGVFIARGPGIKADERVNGANLLDITPTILHLFDLPIGKDMDGRLLASIFEDKPTPQFIESWEKVDGDDGSHPEGMQLNPIESREIMKQMIDLGYVEPLNEDNQVTIDTTVRELEYNLSRSLIDDNRISEAIPKLENLWEKWPGESRFGLQLVLSYISIGQPERARDTLNKLKRQKEDIVQSAKVELLQMEDEISDLEHHELSESKYRKIRDLQMRAATNLPTLAFLEASVLQIEERYEEALHRLDIAIRTQTTNKPAVLFKKGDILLQLGKLDDAQKSFEAAIDFDSNHADAHLGICRCQLRRQEYSRAVESAVSSIALLFHNPQAHYFHGIAQSRCGNRDLAIKALEIAVQQSPNFLQARRKLASLYGGEIN